MSRWTKAEWWKVLHCSAFAVGGVIFLVFSAASLFVKIVSMVEGWAERKELMARYRLKEPAHEGSVQCVQGRCRRG